jgi:hypothetical protein
MPLPGFVTCAFCGDRIGVYEPVVAVQPASTRRTSLAHEPELQESDATLFHLGCADLIGMSVDEP